MWIHRSDCQDKYSILKYSGLISVNLSISHHKNFSFVLGWIENETANGQIYIYIIVLYYIIFNGDCQRKILDTIHSKH